MDSKRMVLPSGLLTVLSCDSNRPMGLSFDLSPGLRIARRSARRRRALGRWPLSVRRRGGSQWWRQAQGPGSPDSAAWNDGKMATIGSETHQNTRNLRGLMFDGWVAKSMQILSNLLKQDRTWEEVLVEDHQCQLNMSSYGRWNSAAWFYPWFSQVPKFLLPIVSQILFNNTGNPKKNQPWMILHKMFSSNYW